MPMASKTGALRPRGKRGWEKGNVKGRINRHEKSKPAANYDPYVDLRRSERSFAIRKPRQFL